MAVYHRTFGFDVWGIYGFIMGISSDASDAPPEQKHKPSRASSQLVIQQSMGIQRWYEVIKFGIYGIYMDLHMESGGMTPFSRGHLWAKSSRNICQHMYYRENRGTPRVRNQWDPGHQNQPTNALFCEGRLSQVVTEGYYVKPDPDGRG